MQEVSFDDKYDEADDDDDDAGGDEDDDEKNVAEDKATAFSCRLPCLDPSVSLYFRFCPFCFEDKVFRPTGDVFLVCCFFWFNAFQLPDNITNGANTLRIVTARFCKIRLVILSKLDYRDNLN